MEAAGKQGRPARAATTGHPAGELPTLDTPHHNAEQTMLMERLVSSIGEDPEERLLKHGHMLDIVGQITSEYLPDISRSISGADRTDPDSTSWGRAQKMYPMYGEEAVLEPRDVTKLLFTVGRNPDGYAAVEVGQEAYMSQLMEYHLNPDLPAGQVVDDDTEGVARRISEKSGEVSGTLALGRQEELAAAGKEADEAYKDSMDLVKSSISGGVGTAVGVGTSVDSSTAWCDMSVDGKLAVRTIRTWWQGGHDTAYFLRGQTLDQVEKSADSGRYMYSGWQAFGKTEGCVDKKYGQELYTGVQTYGSDHRDVDAMKRLIIAFTKTVEKSDECDRKAS